MDQSLLRLSIRIHLKKNKPTDKNTPKRNNMKVIFLDHDGVICLSNNWGSRFKKQKKYRKKLSQSVMTMPLDARFDNFDKKAIKVLNEILEQTGAEIVVSSDWKVWCSVEEMGDYYEKKGIVKRPIDFTTNMIDGDKVTWFRNWDLEGTRSVQIQEWLKEHPEVTHWVAIDDLEMGKTGLRYSMEYEHEWGLDNFVLTPLNNEGIKQVGVKEKVLSFLQG